MADIFREIDEELRADRAARLWKAYGVYVIVAAVLIVVAVGGWVVWRDQRAKALAVEAQRYSDALVLADKGDTEGATRALSDLSANASSGYATLSRLAAAGIEADKGNIDEALRRFDGVAADTSVDPLYRDLATLMAAYRRIDLPDGGNVEARLAPLLNDTSPWRYAARELAGLAALKAGRKADAKTAFQRLTDDVTTPQAMRARATELLSAIGD